MSNYTITTNFGAKDALVSGNPLKLILGAQLTTEFTNLVTAVNSKYDNASTSPAATIIENLNSINAAKALATYETGTFVATSTGHTVAQTPTVSWTRVGNTVTLFIPGFIGVSNANSMTLTGLPAALSPQNRFSGVGFVQIQDNSADQTTPGTISINQNATVITFSKNAVSTTNSFTTSGNKGFSVGQTFTYQLT